MRSTMQLDGLSCVLNMPPALRSVHRGGVEVAQSLPPHAPQPVYLVDEYPGCPDVWERSGPRVVSYFVGVRENSGMWLDFNGCWAHLHDVAVLPSVQGVNPITGQAQEGTALEQYRECCPVHTEVFQDQRFCPECKFHWPAQNYLATTGTPAGHLWIDGFRAKDGVVRQYIFTENEVRSVAAVKLGDKRVHSIGIAYYTSKVKKPEPPHRGVTRGIGGSSHNYSGGITGAPMYKGGKGSSLYTSSVKHVATPSATYNVNHSDEESGVLGFCSASTYTSAPGALHEPDPGLFVPENQNLKALHGASIDGALRGVVEEPLVIKKLEVGAGAKIDQEVHPDPQGLDFWNPEPAAIIYINYTTVEHVREILSAGKRLEQEEGALAGVQVGN